MPRRTKAVREAEALLFLVAIAVVGLIGIAIAVISVISQMSTAAWIVVGSVVLAGAVAFGVVRIQTRKKQLEAAANAEAAAVELRRVRTEKIEANRAVWGDGLAKALLEEPRFDLDDPRVASILARRPEWDEQLCGDLLSREVKLDMTADMVRLAWGAPNQIEDKEVTKKGTKTRWRYGQARQGARYVWFNDGVVTKIEQ